MKFCRSAHTYVDPTSEEPIELGTKQYPFKTFNLPFVEIATIHSNADTTTNVWVREGTVVPFKHGHHPIFNATQINFGTYHPDPSMMQHAQATVEIRDEADTSVEVMNPKTQFNVLANTDFDYDAIVDQAAP